MGIFSAFKNRFVTKKSSSDKEKITNADAYTFDIDVDEGAMQWFKDVTELPAKRRERRNAYDRIDQEIIDTILNMYAGDATQFNLDHNAVAWVESDNQEVVNICTELFKRLEVDENSFAIVRGLCKYGEEFDRLTYSQYRIISWEPMNDLTYMVYNKDNVLKGYSLKSDEDGEHSLPWDFVPFILKGKNRNRKYGTSMLDPLYKPYSRLDMTEDSAAIYRVMQIPDRDVFRVDCTGLTPIQAKRRVEQVKKTLTQQRFVNSGKTGMSKEFNFPNTATGIYVIPFYQDRQDSFEKQSSSSRVQDVYDLEFFATKLSSVSSIPPEVLGFNFSGGLNFNAEKSLAMQDVKYARMVKRPQSAYLKGLTILCEIELCLKGIDPTKKDNIFKVCGDPISFIEELQRQELYTARLGIVDSFTRLSRDLGIEGQEFGKYLLKRFANFTPEMLDLIYGDSEEPNAEMLSDATKKKLDEEYHKNKNLQKKVKEVSEMTIHHFKDAMSRAEERSKYDSSRLYLPFMDEENTSSIFAWKTDVVNIGKQIKLLEGSNKRDDIKKVNNLKKDLDKYVNLSYNSIKNG